MPRNGYSLYCAELMVNMKDVPSTERMVLCSKRWKLMTQKEKDLFQKRCEQVGAAGGLTCWVDNPGLTCPLSPIRKRSSTTWTCRGFWRYVDTGLETRPETRPNQLEPVRLDLGRT